MFPSLSQSVRLRQASSGLVRVTNRHSADSVKSKKEEDPCRQGWAEQRTKVHTKKLWEIGDALLLGGGGEGERMGIGANLSLPSLSFPFGNNRIVITLTR